MSETDSADRQGGVVFFDGELQLAKLVLPERGSLVLADGTSIVFTERSTEQVKKFSFACQDPTYYSASCGDNWNIEDKDGKLVKHHKAVTANDDLIVGDMSYFRVRPYFFAKSVKYGDVTARSFSEWESIRENHPNLVVGAPVEFQVNKCPNSDCKPYYINDCHDLNPDSAAVKAAKLAEEQAQLEAAKKAQEEAKEAAARDAVSSRYTGSVSFAYNAALSGQASAVISKIPAAISANDAAVGGLATVSDCVNAVDGDAGTITCNYAVNFTSAMLEILVPSVIPASSGTAGVTGVNNLMRDTFTPIVLALFGAAAADQAKKDAATSDLGSGSTTTVLLKAADRFITEGQLLTGNTVLAHLMLASAIAAKVGVDAKNVHTSVGNSMNGYTTLTVVVAGSSMDSGELATAILDGGFSFDADANPSTPNVMWQKDAEAPGDMTGNVVVRQLHFQHAKLYSMVPLSKSMASSIGQMIISHLVKVTAQAGRPVTSSDIYTVQLSKFVELPRARRAVLPNSLTVTLSGNPEGNFQQMESSDMTGFVYPTGSTAPADSADGSKTPDANGGSITNIGDVAGSQSGSQSGSSATEANNFVNEAQNNVNNYGSTDVKVLDFMFDKISFESWTQFSQFGTTPSFFASTPRLTIGKAKEVAATNDGNWKTALNNLAAYIARFYPFTATAITFNPMRVDHMAANALFTEDWDFANFKVTFKITVPSSSTLFTKSSDTKRLEMYVTEGLVLMLADSEVSQSNAAISQISGGGSGGGGIPIAAVAGAAAGVILIIVIIVIVMRKRGGSGARTDPVKSDRTVVAFENPMYDSPETNVAQPTYAGETGDNEGLYDEPAFNADANKANPVYQSTENLAEDYGTYGDNEEGGGYLDVAPDDADE